MASTLVPTALLLLLLLLPYLLLQESLGFFFEDVSLAAGLDYSGDKRLKYGGASVADLDGDGFPDLLFGHHSQPPELYYNLRNGTFAKVDSWRIFRDTHGINPFRFNPWRKHMHFSVSIGGGYGLRPQPPIVYETDAGRHLVNDVTTSVGLGAVTGRGRSLLFTRLTLRKSSQASAIVLNGPIKGNPLVHTAVRGRRGPRFETTSVPGYETNRNAHAYAINLHGGSRPEIVSFPNLAVHTVIADFRLRDVTSTWLRNTEIKAVVAVAAIDFDNDGLMDLYVARTNTGPLKWVKNSNVDDRLLRNRGTHFEDVSEQVGIPKGRQSRGVTAGDFDNNGWTDLLICLGENEQDILLMNQAPGVFDVVTAQFDRKADVPGDMAVAVDYDRDGRLDAIISEGDYNNRVYGGQYRIMKNIADRNDIGNYLLVRVRTSPQRIATSLHAVVRVRVGSMWMIRMVGSPGSAVSHSYVELLHFGLGNARVVDEVRVLWQDGGKASLENVRVNRIVVVGRWP